jgi:hypothetical protein
MSDSPTSADKLANNVIITLVARAAMIFGATVGLPVVGWMLQHSINVIDAMTVKIDTIQAQTFETSGTIRLIQQMQTAQGQILADHEARVRALENTNRGRASGSVP